MLRFLPLVMTTLARKPLRTILTVLCVGVTFLLFGILESFRYGLTDVVAHLNDDRLITLAAANQPLPLSHLGVVRRTPGVIAASGVVYVPIMLPPGRSMRGALAVDPAEILEVYPEMRLSASERQRWLNERTAAIVNQTLARRQGWKAGDTVSLAGSTYVKRDGTRNWEVTIVGVYPPALSGLGELYFHQDYFNEAVLYGANTLAMVLSRVSGPAVADRVREQIDAQFVSSAAATRTVALNAYMRRAVTQLGNIGMLIIGVIVISFFTMLLITASTIGQSVRERAGEFAVMKTLGFTNVRICTLVLSEALLMCVAGALLAFLLVAQMSAMSEQQGPNVLPLALAHLLSTGALLIAGCTISACLLPLQQVWRENIVEGLRHE